MAKTAIGATLPGGARVDTPSGARRRNVPTIVYPLVLVVLAIFLVAPRLSGPIDLRYDAGVYYVLGTSLAEGKGYRLLNEPGEPAAVQYPPALPALAAAYQRLAGTSDPLVVGPWLRLTFGVLFIAYPVAVFFVGMLFLTAPLAFVAGLFTLMHVHTTWLSELFFAEIPFALVSLVAFLLMRRSSAVASTWVVWLLASVGFLLRTAGIALLAAWAGESLLRRRFREFALRAALAAIPVFAWQGYIASVKSDPDYPGAYPYQRASYQFYNVPYLENLSLIDPFIPELGYATPSDWLLRLGRNLASMPASWGGAITADAARTVHGLQRVLSRTAGIQLPNWLAMLPFTILGLLALAGLVLIARRREFAIPLYVFGSTAIVCLTPWPGQFQRYLAPLTPLLVISFLVALAALQGRIRPAGWGGRIRSALVPATVVVLLLAQAWPLYKSYANRAPAPYRDASGQERSYPLFFYTDGWRVHDRMLDWLEKVSRPGEVVATAAPHWAYLRNGLIAVMPPFEADAATAQSLVEAVPISYLILDELEFIDISRRYAARMVEAFPERWELVHTMPDTRARVYRLRR